MTNSSNYQPIENYGLIGDLNSVALVGMDGSIDYMCLPDMDSPSVFARLLDHKKGGHFAIVPDLGDVKYKQIYLSDTNVLFTRFISEDGVAEISDFFEMNDSGAGNNLIRRVKTVRGNISYTMECAPAFDYGRAGHRTKNKGNAVEFIASGAHKLRLRLFSNVAIKLDNNRGISQFSLKEGDTATFVLDWDSKDTGIDKSTKKYVGRAFRQTVNYWQKWIEKSTYAGRWREAVNRSALALKLLTSRRHGSIAAAATFGLPEEIAGERNWDYRYTWIRDASFTVYAFIRLGLTDEAAEFIGWLMQICSNPQAENPLQVMYRLDGSTTLDEEELLHLEGYQGSRPVRIGNGAQNQLQLDIYGELLDSVYLYDKYGAPISGDVWQTIVTYVNWISENWNQPDYGIWEVRGKKRNFLYSRVMAWVALDRALRLAEKRSLDAPADKWKLIRDEIHASVYQDFWDEQKGAFVQYDGAKILDASSLMMPLVKFIKPNDPRWLSHLNKVEEELVSDSLVYRYQIESSEFDGLEGEEGTFSICTFWYVECLSRSGQIDKARFYFEKMLSYANHLGLFSEELGPRGEHLGNYPQAFTHLALISAAYDIDRRLSARQKE